MSSDSEGPGGRGVGGGHGDYLKRKHLVQRERVRVEKELPNDAVRERFKEIRKQANKAKAELAHVTAAKDRKDRRREMQKQARHAFESDATYRLLHLSTARVLAKALLKDMEALQSGKSVSSLAAKWAPSPDGAHDKATLMATTLAELLFPRQPAYWERGVPSDYATYVALARQRLQKEVLAPLRAASKVPEVAMSAGKWEEVDYSRVASTCMKLRKGVFERHDKARFEAFMESVKKGEKKVAAGALKPHEIIQDVERGDGQLATDVAEEQWKAYVKKLTEVGQLSSALAVCDVSGSMEGEPMEVAVALSLLVSEVSKPPFNRLICSFHEQPALHEVQGDTLAEKAAWTKRLEWGGSTNLDSVFDLILDRAVAFNLKKEEVVQTLFIFSDMEFDQACWGHGHGPMTNFQRAKHRFAEHGYDLPAIVFWNLRGGARYSGQGASCPVQKDERGAALVSGFSGQLLKLFLDNPAELRDFTPDSVLAKALEPYKAWRPVLSPADAARAKEAKRKRAGDGQPDDEEEPAGEGEGEEGAAPSPEKRTRRGDRAPRGEGK